jgi:hypothetical protein
MYRFVPQQTMANPLVIDSFKELMKHRYSHAQLATKNPELASALKNEKCVAVVKSVLRAESLGDDDAQVQAILAAPDVTTSLTETMDFQYTYVQMVKNNPEKAETEKNNHWADVIESIKWAYLVHLPLAGAVAVPAGAVSVPSNAIEAGRLLMVSQEASADVLELEAQAVTYQLAPALYETVQSRAGDTFDDISSV